MVLTKSALIEEPSEKIEKSSSKTAIKFQQFGGKMQLTFTKV